MMKELFIKWLEFTVVSYISSYILEHLTSLITF
jgi:hypothetical protein